MRIKITEAQFKMLVESEASLSFDGGDLKEYPESEISTTTNVTKPNGDLEYGRPMNTGSDKVTKKLAVQNNYINGRATVSRSI